MKTSFILATLLLSNVATSSATLTEPLDEALYLALNVPEESFQYIYPETGLPLIGVVRFQKGIPGLFCRKSAPPGPDRVYSYACFQKMTHINAKSTFDSMNAILFKVSFQNPETGTPRHGKTVFERFEEQLICQKTIHYIEGLAPQFACYERLSL